MLLKFFFFALGISCGVSMLHAAPLSATAVPEGAQWVFHLDVDRMRSTQTGESLIRELRERDMGQEEGAFYLNPILILSGLRSLTLSGTNLDFQEAGNRQRGVMVVEGTTELIQVAQGAIAAMQLEEPERVRVVDESEDPIYVVDGGYFGALLDERRIVIGNALTEVKDVIAIQRGKRSSADLSKRFEGRGIKRNEAFLSLFAEGFSKAEGLSGQARMLRLTDGFSLQLREAADNLHLDTSFSTGSTQVARQVQQVLQGLIAVFSLVQRDDADVSTLVQSARVSSEDRSVQLGLRYPVDRAVEWTSRFADQAQAAVRESTQAPLSMPQEAEE